jgi:hypothetical protein
MNCSICGRRAVDCKCETKQNVTAGRWPVGTWFQRRIKKVRIKSMLETKNSYTRDAGASSLDVILFLGIAAGLIVGLLLLGNTLRSAFNLWEAASRCVAALLECRSI